MTKGKEERNMLDVFREALVDDIDQQVMDVADYLCSRGDTMPLRGQVEARTRRILYALQQKGWQVTRKPPLNTEVQEAVERERERCAKIAEDHLPKDMWEARDSTTEYNRACRDINAAIREGEG